MMLSIFRIFSKPTSPPKKDPVEDVKEQEQEIEQTYKQVSEARRQHKKAVDDLLGLLVQSESDGSANK